MVLPLLYGLGAKDHVEPRGYLLLTCQRCKISGPFLVMETQRKVTFYSITTPLSVREQLVIECRACTQRFAVPPEMREEFLGQVMSEEQLLARLRRDGALGLGAGPGAKTERTFYQILQVDPSADPEVIEAAFRRLAMKYHPDTSTDPEASNRMREIIEARECLSDAERRLVYDRSIGILRRPSGLRPEDI
jgi:hypothetical protein